VFVSNEDAGTISVIDAAQDVVLRSVSVGKRPRGLRLSADESFLYVAVSGSPKAPPGVDESKLPAADRGADGIAVIDLHNYRVVRTIESGADPEAFDLSPDGRIIYVSNEDTAQASLLDTRSGRLQKSIPVGGEPEGVTTRPDGAVVYVTSEQEGRVDVLDAQRASVIARVPTGQRPRSVVFSADGTRAYVSNELGASVSVIDSERHLPLGEIALNAQGARPMGLALASDGLTLYVTTGRAGSVAYLDVTAKKVQKVVDDVGARPWGIGLTPDGGKLYTANGPSNDVSVIQAATGKLLKRIPVGGSPWGIAISRKQHRDHAGMPPLSPGKLEVPQAMEALHQARALQADDGQWVSVAKNYENTRFSRLDEIRVENAGQLQVSWSLSTGLLHGHEAAPLIVGSMLYAVTPFPNRLIAVDLKNPKAGPKWVYDPDPVPAAQGVACCDVVNRGAAYANGAIFYNTLDGHTVAVDAESGREIWKTRLADINRAETITMAPLVVKNKVLVGNSGGEYGVRGWLTALDASTGQIAWRAYSTGPDKEVLIGPGFRPFYASDQGKDLGMTTWPPDKWRMGGGTVWGFISYDPDLDLLFYGTGNPGPWNGDQRPGDNKWSCGVFARRPETGEAVWHYQWSPHDLFDHDGINENIVLDLELDGTPRKVIVHVGRTGYVYVLGRQSGQVISATPFVHNTTSRGVDLKTGRLRNVPEMEVGTGRTRRRICPASPGGKDWQPAAYSSQTNLLYIPANNLCQDQQGYEANYIAGTPYLGANVTMYAGPGGHRGELIAWDVAKRKPVFRIKEKFPVWSGVLATAGGLVFYGTMDGWFKAIDARSGKELWKQKLESGVVGQPVTFRGPDGRQYVSVFAGVGGWSGAVVSGRLDPRDATGALGFLGATGDLPAHSSRGGTLYTFGLP
jgi:PQQ-dependent dehydrogenase (methanol/ethanol family)